MITIALMQITIVDGFITLRESAEDAKWAFEVGLIKYTITNIGKIFWKKTFVLDYGMKASPPLFICALDYPKYYECGLLKKKERKKEKVSEQKWHRNTNSEKT